METHADQLLLQKSQPPGKEKNCVVTRSLGLLIVTITLELNPFRKRCLVGYGGFMWATCIAYPTSLHIYLVRLFVLREGKVARYTFIVFC